MRCKADAVALLAEGVDRNPALGAASVLRRGVALLAEGVDRNLHLPSGRTGQNVALLAEGVDRNFELADLHVRFDSSPSSRRAWIEMHCFFHQVIRF